MPNLTRRSSAIAKATPRASQVLEEYDYWLRKEYGKSGTYLTNAKTFLKTVGPALGTHLIAQREDILYIIHIHAANDKINYQN